jgi:PAS domain S-box-containing protein
MHPPHDLTHWQQQAAMVYRMIIANWTAIHRDYAPKKHVCAAFQEMFVAMMIRVNEADGQKPISISALAKRLDMSRSNVRRAISALISHKGVVRKSGEGYIGDPDYVAARADADDYIPEVQQAIQTAAAQLAAYKGKSNNEGMDLIPTAAWRARPDGYIDYVNKYWLDYAGVSLEQALGWEWKALIHPDDLPSLLETWQKVLASERPGEAVARMRRHDGSHGRLVVRAEPVLDDKGAVVAWYGTNMDIPETVAPDCIRMPYRNAQFRQELKALIAKYITSSSTLADYCCVTDELYEERQRLDLEADKLPDDEIEA